MKKFSPKKRHKARKCALQSLYQWQYSAGDVEDIVRQFAEAGKLGNIDQEYYQDLLNGVVQHVEEIDATITPALDREMEKLNPIELCVLRLAVYELNYHMEIPYKVILDEAIEITKTYGATDGYKYINGVLDKLIKTLRQAELAAK